MDVNLFLLFLSWGCLIFIFTLLRAQMGYLFPISTFCRCSSFSRSCWFEHTAMALWYSVFITLYLAAMVWWLSHCRYKSVWVGFLYTVVLKLPSECPQRDGPITMTLFTGEFDLVINRVDMLYEVFFLCFLNDHKCVIHKSSPQARGCGAVLIVFVSNASIYKLAFMGLMGEPMAAPSTCS